MSRFNEVLIYLFLQRSVFLTTLAAQSANIISPPQSVNVSLNEVAHFNCTGSASHFEWKANGNTIIFDYMVEQVQGNQLSTLQLPATSSFVDNITNITCTAIKVNPLSSDESEAALLLVQGLLESVSNLAVTQINYTTALISWSPPFTLEGVPILGYNVTIIDTASKKLSYETIFVENSMLYHSIEDFNNSFTVIVVPINEVGAGKSTHIPILQKAFSIEMSKSEFSMSPTSTRPFTQLNSTYLRGRSSALVSSKLVSSALIVVPTTPVSSGDVTISVVALVMIAVIFLVMVLVFLCTTIAIVCCCYHRKRSIIIVTEKTLCPSQDVTPPVIHDNPAYDSVHNLKLKENSTNSAKYSTQDYENIEEVYFKRRNDIEGVYEQAV